MIKKPLNVALYPQEIYWGDKEKNIDTIINLMPKLHHDTDLLILPEMFSTGFLTGDKEEIRQLSERNTGKTIELLKSLALKYQIAIAGSFIADSGGSLYNRAFLIEPNGEENFADKRHLFTMAGEGKTFSRGYDRMAVRYRGWNITMIVCYDVRFPVWCRNSNNEYDLMIAVANWPTVRANAWKQLLIARAMENQAYVCGVNCKGVDTNGFEYGGDTFAIDFKGLIINNEDQENGIIYAQLNAEKLDAFRTKFPAWQDADEFELKK